MIAKGSTAADFCLMDQSGQRVCLSFFKGMKVCLFFLPDIQALENQLIVIGFAREYARFQQLGIHVIGICGEDVDTYFIREHGVLVPFPLLSDRNQVARKQYDVWKQKIVFGQARWLTVRSALCIDEKGIVCHTFKRLNIDHGVQDILAFLQHRHDKEEWRKLSRRTKERIRREQAKKHDVIKEK